MALLGWIALKRSAPQVAASCEANSPPLAHLFLSFQLPGWYSTEAWLFPADRLDGEGLCFLCGLSGGWTGSFSGSGTPTRSKIRYQALLESSVPWGAIETSSLVFIAAMLLDGGRGRDRGNRLALARVLMNTRSPVSRKAICHFR